MLSSDKSNIFVSMKVHLTSVYEKILSSMKVNLSSMKVNLSSSKVNLSSSKVNLSSWKVGSSGSKVNLSSSKVNLSKILILKSIVYCVCVMFSSDVSWGSMEEKENEINDNDIVLKEISIEEANNKNPQEYCVIFMGYNAVGNTQIVKVKEGNEFDKKYEPTIDWEYCSFFYNYKIKGKDYHKAIQLSTCEFGFTQKWRLYNNTSRKADVIVLVYDITNENSFQGTQSYLEELKTLCTNDPVYFLVGNKADLEDQRKVTKEEAQKFAEEKNMQFFEVSAKTGKDINELFEAIAKACVMKNINSKNKRCSCCPCCNKDEDDKKEETKSPKSPLYTQTGNTHLN